MTEARDSALSVPLSVQSHGQDLDLLADRAVFWHQRQALLVADTHFGKDAAFRDHGIALPSGTDQQDLDRLGRLLDATMARELWILGDFLHARPTPEHPFPALFSAWRSARPDLAVHVITGNHDRLASGRWFVDLVDWEPESVEVGPMILAHAPLNDPPPRSFPRLCGHLHPVVRLRERSLADQRFPVFWRSADQWVLPSFGSFTGGMMISPKPEDQIFAIIGSELVPLPARACRL